MRPAPPCRPAGPGRRCGRPPAGGQRHGAVHQVGAALDRAAVLAARHHLLAGVAALLEVDAAHQFQVQHLRHELLGRGGDDARHAALHFEPAPGIGVAAAAAAALGAGPQDARHALRRGQAHQLRLAEAAARPVAGRQRALQQRVGRRPGQPVQRPVGAEPSLSLHLARSTYIDSRFSVAGSRSALQASSDVVRRHLPGDEGGQQPALGRAVAGQARLAVAQVQHVLRQLAVEEGRGLGALGADQAPVGQRQRAVGVGGRQAVFGHAAIIIAAHVFDVQGVAPPADGRRCVAAAGGAGGGERLALAEPAAAAGRAGGRAVDRARHHAARGGQGWVAAGVQASPELLYEWFRWSGQARRIRAGSYEIETGVTPRQLLAKMVQGDETLETAAPGRRLDLAPGARRTGRARRT